MMTDPSRSQMCSLTTKRNAAKIALEALREGAARLPVRTRLVLGRHRHGNDRLGNPFEVMEEVFEHNPELTRTLFASIAHEAAILGEHLIDAARRSAYERVSHLLLELCARLNSGHAIRDATFSIPLTQELLAEALGLTTLTARCLR